MKKLGILAVIILVIGAAWWFGTTQKKPSIQIDKVDQDAQTVAFTVSIEGKEYSNSYKFGTVKKLNLGKYSFQATTEGKKAKLSLHDEVGNYILGKAVPIQ